jgi:hypothetical protein
MAKGTKCKTKVGGLKYVFIKGEGRNQAMPGEPDRMQYVASLVAPENGEVHKAFLKHIDEEWQAYKSQFGVKGLPKTNGIKLETTEDPSGEIDPATEKVKKIPTGNVLIGFKTNTAWPNGNAQIIKVFDRKGQDITNAYQAADWSIGEGSTGIIHGTAQANNVGGTHKVTLYLTAVQIATLSKYVGDEPETEEIEGDDIDLGDAVSAVPSDESPDL